MEGGINNWRLSWVNGVEVVGSIEHLLWRLSEDNHTLIPFVGEEAVHRLFTHIGDTLVAARLELAGLQGEAERNKAAINRLDNQVLEQGKEIYNLRNELELTRVALVNATREEPIEIVTTTGWADIELPPDNEPAIAPSHMSLPANADTPWPTIDAVNHLLEFTEMHLRDKDYTGHGWEQTNEAVKVVRQAIASGQNDPMGAEDDRSFQIATVLSGPFKGRCVSGVKEEGDSVLCVFGRDEDYGKEEWIPKDQLRYWIEVNAIHSNGTIELPDGTVLTREQRMAARGK